MTEIDGMAESLGRALARTTEYRAMISAMQSADNDREVVGLRNEVEGLEESLRSAVQKGEEPSPEKMRQFETAVGRLQTLSAYQSLIAAHANFDKIMHRVDAAMQEGMSQSSASRIILA